MFLNIKAFTGAQQQLPFYLGPARSWQQPSRCHKHTRAYKIRGVFPPPRQPPASAVGEAHPTGSSSARACKPRGGGTLPSLPLLPFAPPWLLSPPPFALLCLPFAHPFPSLVAL